MTTTDPSTASASPSSISDLASTSDLAPTIALVDDDQHLLTSVSVAFQSEGFTVRVYSDGASALKALLENPPDLAILDIKMPRLDGIELLKRLREQSALPVIFLTSKHQEVDEAAGLRMGADDYIGKPFSQRLLIERAKAVLRRAHLRQETASTQQADKRNLGQSLGLLERNGLILDLDRHRVSWLGSDITLTVTEFLILQALIQRPGVVKSRDQLLDAAYQDEIYVDDRTIDSHIKRLRKKFRQVDPKFKQIETLYGVGYRYNERP